MAHQINFNQQTGKHSFMSVKEKPWHSLGQIIDRYPTSSEAIAYAGLNYTVEKRPLFTCDIKSFLNEGSDDIISPNVAVPGFFATVRNDTDQVLGVVGNDYEVVQNADAFSFFDAIDNNGDGILYETAGALGNGERVFIAAKLPDYIRVGVKDRIEQYLFLSTSHDGLGSITAAFTPIRIVCNNTLNAAMNNHSGAIKIRHTASAAGRLKQAHTLMGITRKLGNDMEELFNMWSKLRISDAEVKKLIQIAMAPNKEVLTNLAEGKFDLLSSHYNNMVDKVYEDASGNDTQQMETTAGTLFGAYNGVTGYFQNVHSFKSDEAKFRSIMDGTAKQRVQTAFNLCLDFAANRGEALMYN